MAIYSVFRVLILVILCTVCEAGSCVYAYSSYTVNNGQHSRHTITGAIYCTSGCCGYYNERECCSDSTAAIVTGSVLGGIVLIGVVAGIITCCCHYKNKREVVVQPVYYITADAQLERITVCEAWEYCYYSYFSHSQNRYKKGSFYCSTSCCGYYDDRYCCTESGMIAGAVVGGTICIVVIAGIIVCCIKSHMMKPGRVIQPASINTVQHYQNIQLPPQYYSHLPTQSGVTNPAYPPPPPAPPGYSPQLAPVGPVQPPPYVGPPPKY